MSVCMILFKTYFAFASTALAASAVFAIDRVIGAAGFLGIFARDQSTPRHNSW
jgi:hypothetical protein